MARKSILYLGLALVAIMWALNALALKFYFYWTLGWYDYMMHFLGGLVLGVLVTWVLNPRQRSFKTFLIIFASAIVLGGVWEVFEYVNGITESTENYKIDTIHDLIMDSLGIVVAYFYTISPPRQSLEEL